LRSAALHFAQGLQAKRGNKVGGRSRSAKNHASPALSWQEMDLFIFIALPSKRSPSGCFIALRRLSCFLQLASLPPSVPLLVCCKASHRTEAIAIALRHPAALHHIGATCAPARSY